MTKKKKNQPQSKLMVDMVEGRPSTFRLVAFISFLNITNKNTNWWLDSCINIHVCNDRAFFFSYQDSSGGSMIIANGIAINVLDSGNVNLSFISRKNNIL